jgi:hypothetical protein
LLQRRAGVSRQWYGYHDYRSSGIRHSERDIARCARRARSEPPCSEAILIRPGGACPASEESSCVPSRTSLHSQAHCCATDRVASPRIWATATARDALVRPTDPSHLSQYSTAFSTCMWQKCYALRRDARVPLLAQSNRLWLTPSQGAVDDPRWAIALTGLSAVNSAKPPRDPGRNWALRRGEVWLHWRPCISSPNHVSPAPDKCPWRCYWPDSKTSGPITDESYQNPKGARWAPRERLQLPVRWPPPSVVIPLPAGSRRRRRRRRRASDQGLLRRRC